MEGSTSPTLFTQIGCENLKTPLNLKVSTLTFQLLHFIITVLQY